MCITSWMRRAAGPAVVVFALAALRAAPAAPVPPSVLAAARAKAGAHAHQRAAAGDGVAAAQLSGLYYAARGSSGGAERALASGVCYCCKTALAAGPGGALYAAWRHVYPGGFRDMAFALSRDGGRTFGAAVAWDEVIGKMRVASVREIRRKADGTLDAGAVVTLAERGPAMYPALAATDAGFVAVWATGGTASAVRARLVELP